MCAVSFELQVQSWGDGTPLTHTFYVNAKFHSGQSIIITECKAEMSYLSDLPTCRNNSKPRVVNQELALEKIKSKKVVQSVLNISCTVVLLANLEYPHLIKTHCSTKLLRTFVCVKSEQPSNDYTHETDHFHMCPQGSLRKAQNCIVVEHLPTVVWNKLPNICSQRKMMPYHFAIDDVSFVTDVVKLSTILNTNLSNVFLYDEITDSYKIKSFTNQTTKSFVFCMLDRKRIIVGLNLHKCLKRTVYISAEHICDNIPFCNDTSDEKFCFCKSNALKSSTAQKIQLQNEECPNLLLQGGSGEQLKYTGHQRNTRTEEVNSKIGDLFVCLDGKEISSDLIDDLVPDCHAGEDETTLKSVLTGNAQFYCGPRQLPCFDHHVRCFHFASLCLYSLNDYFHVVPCRNGRHLGSCKMFECNLEHKCPLTHCIPQTYVCDGKWDCPGGHDEKNILCDKVAHCENMFLCVGLHSQKICIPLGYVCDQRSDCLNGEDEMFCDLSAFSCPINCQCLLYAIDCKNMTQIHVTLCFLLNYVKLTHVPITEDKLGVFQKAYILVLNWLNLTVLCNKLSSCNLTCLDVAHNLIHVLENECFENLVQIKQLNLSHNNLKMVESNSMSNLKMLSVLDLSHNLFLIFPEEFMSSGVSLSVLSVIGNTFLDLDAKYFAGIRIQKIKTDTFRICCVAGPGSLCNAKPPWYLHCGFLLTNIHARELFLTIGGIIMVFNVCAAVFQFIEREGTTAFAIMVISTSVNKTVFSFFLFVVAIGDLQFGNSFPLKEVEWRKSVMCFLSSETILLHNIASPFLLCLMYLARYSIVKMPFDSQFKSTKFVAKCIGSVWMMSVVASILALLCEIFTLDGVPNVICHPFIDYYTSTVTVKTIAILLALIQTIACILICHFHSSLMKQLKKSQENISKYTAAKSNLDSNSAIIIQLVSLSASCALCWVSTNVTFVVVNFLNNYPVQLVQWCSATVAPINAILHPCIFFGVSWRKCLKERSQKNAQKQQQWGPCK